MGRLWTTARRRVCLGARRGMKRSVRIFGGIGVVIVAVLAVRLVLSTSKAPSATRAHALEASSVSRRRTSSSGEPDTVLSGRAVTRLARTTTTPLQPQPYTDTAAAVAETSEPVTITEEAVRVWAATDPEGAADYLLRLPPGPERTALLLALAAVWAEAAPEKAAAKLLKTIATPEELALAGEIAAAERFLCEQQKSAAWPAITCDAAYALASTHPALAERLAETLDDGAEQERILSRVRRRRAFKTL